MCPCSESAPRYRILPADAVPEAHLRRTSCSDATSHQPCFCSVDIPFRSFALLTSVNDIVHCPWPETPKDKTSTTNLPTFSAASFRATCAHIHPARAAVPVRRCKCSPARSIQPALVSLRAASVPAVPESELGGSELPRQLLGQMPVSVLGTGLESSDPN